MTLDLFQIHKTPPEIVSGNIVFLFSSRTEMTVIIWPKPPFPNSLNIIDLIFLHLRVCCLLMACYTADIGLFTTTHQACNLWTNLGGPYNTFFVYRFSFSLSFQNGESRAIIQHLLSAVCNLFFGSLRASTYVVRESNISQRD